MDDSNNLAWKGVIQRYRDFIKVGSDSLKAPYITLHEGNTPLIESVFLQRELREIGFSGKIYFKYEGLNPTASFKDRGMTVAVTRARDINSKALICASTGNTSASAAAYGARAGIPVFVVVPEKGITLGKLVQAIAYGAKIIKIKGNFDDAMNIVKKIADDFGLFIVNSINPWRIQGQKTASFEICDFLGYAPDYHFLPVGNAANIYAYWLGYKEYFEIKKIKNLPKMCGIQAAGASPIVKGHPIKDPKTVASAIRIGNPVNWEKAKLAKEESDGVIDSVEDDEIIKSYRILSQCEGIFCELSSSASVAGLIKLAKNRRLSKDCVVVCTLTGNGLKDPQAALDFIKTKEIIVEPNFHSIKKIIEEEVKKSQEKRSLENEIMTQDFSSDFLST
ncbi:MAG: threonine synthase [bacterium]|nr:threonine synthase [bacterium]